MKTLPYGVVFQELGRGPKTTRRFKTLHELQQYVYDRWQGVDYMDGPRSFHTDYCLFWIDGATLSDLGRRRSDDPKSDEFWNWEWHALEKSAGRIKQ